MRLNGWQRIGVLLSGAWIAGIAVTAAAELPRVQNQSAKLAFFAMPTYNKIELSKHPASAPVPSNAAASSPDVVDAAYIAHMFDDVPPARQRFRPWWFLLLLLGPVVLLWCGTYGVLCASRWLYRGFVPRKF